MNLVISSTEATSFTMGIDPKAKGSSASRGCPLALRPVIAAGNQEVGVEVQAAVGHDAGFEGAQGSSAALRD